jgi:hypothetical protein
MNATRTSRRERRLRVTNSVAQGAPVDRNFDDASVKKTFAERRGENALVRLSLLGIAALMPAPAIAQDISEDWQFAASLYAWFPDIAGNTSIRTENGVPINVDIGTILDNLEMTGQGSFGLQKGRWGGFTDVIYLGVGASTSRTRNLSIGGRPLPGAVTGATDLDLDTLIWTLAGSFRIAGSPAATFDVLAGARYAAIEVKLEWEFTGNFGPVAAPPRTGEGKSSGDLLDGIVGVKGHFALGHEHKWLIPYYLDVGTGDSDATWQALLGFGYAFGWGDLSVAWRYLDYDLKSDAPIADLNFNGPAAGVTFRW